MNSYFKIMSTLHIGRLQDPARCSVGVEEWLVFITLKNRICWLTYMDVSSVQGIEVIKIIGVKSQLR